MNKEPRKASEIIASLETKVDTLIKLNSTLSLNMNILSNKLNSLIDGLDNLSQSMPEEMVSKVSNNTPTVMAPQMPDLNALKTEMITAQQKVGDFRRTSRPETFVEKPQTAPPPTITAPTVAQSINQLDEGVAPNQNPADKFAITQRVVNKEGKAVFLADVEIVNAQNRQTEFKGRTTGVGRWQATLPIGKYQVIIRKKDMATQQQLENLQNLIVDGSLNPLELKMVVLQ